jgi:hypothetical protein
MRKPPYSPTLNLATLLWGLRLGLYELVVTTAFSFLCGIVITVAGNAGWVNLSISEKGNLGYISVRRGMGS